MTIKKILFFIIFFLALAVFHSPAKSQESFEAEIPIIENQYQEETLEAKIIKILEEKEIQPLGSQDWQLYQKLELLVTNGSLKDQTITVENGDLSVANLQRYKIGDEVVLTYSQDEEESSFFYIIDYVRRQALAWLFVIFLLLAVIVGGWQGISSLLGMAMSFLVIFKFILPRISAGSDPVLIAIIGSLLIIPVTFLLSHGINKKTAVAVAGTLISLVITGILAHYFVDLAKLTGFASEEAAFLQSFHPGLINIKGLLLAGIIIGVLGVLDDITISQAAIVKQLKEINPKLKPTELYQKAMNVGKDHIASMVNTLILVYTGASLPLLLLFIDNPHPFTEIVNYEIIAEEIVRTLVGSIGLIAAVPITTFIASLVCEQKT